MKKPSTPTRPFLKWAGNKYRVVDRIVTTLPDGKRLVEPFVGSGALFLNTSYKRYLLCDANVDLITLYQILKEQGDGFIEACRPLFTEDNNSAERYYELRDEFNACSDPLRRSVLFIYLNRHGYNGLCRYNATWERRSSKRNCLSKALSTLRSSPSCSPYSRLLDSTPRSSSGELCRSYSSFSTCSPFADSFQPNCRFNFSSLPWRCLLFLSCTISNGDKSASLQPWSILGMLVFLERDRRAFAAALLAFAASFKFFPLIFIAPFIIRRDFRFLLYAVIACSTFLIAIPCLLLGIEGTLNFYSALLDSYRHFDWVIANYNSQHFPHVLLRLMYATGFMKIPLQITYRHMEATPAIEENIREKAAKLDTIYDGIMGCRVAVERRTATITRAKPMWCVSI